jgi:hypothetical protein
LVDSGPSCALTAWRAASWLMPPMATPSTLIPAGIVPLSTPPDTSSAMP